MCCVAYVGVCVCVCIGRVRYLTGPDCVCVGLCMYLCVCMCVYWQGELFDRP